MNVRFAEPCRVQPLDLNEFENRIARLATDAPACHECAQDIFLGLFFDGTNNNKFRDTPNFAHSNVARLYEAFIGKTANLTPPTLPSQKGQEERKLFPDTEFKPKDFPEKEYNYYRKIYIPGVGTPFPDVKDSGQNGLTKQKTRGLAMAYMGEIRLDWAMLQVCNQVHAAVFGKALYESLNFQSILLDARKQLEQLGPPSTAESPQAHERRQAERIKTLDRISAASRHQLDAELAQIEKQLSEALTVRLTNKPSLRRIRLSVFGFSRGAAAARAFVNRVVQRWGSTLSGVTLSIDFLGLFDTVASVGLAQSVPGADGHFAWASGYNMAIPAGRVGRCVHLVAAHEVRASFPLDSICQGEKLPENCKEIVYPGVHSDVGGGYPPNDQGRSLGSGADGDCLKLSQVALTQMYREARMAGVPIGTTKQLVAHQKQNFELSPVLRADFNDYVEATRTGRVPPTNGQGEANFARMFPTEEQKRHSLDELVALHYGHFLRWRKSVLGRAHRLPGMEKNTNPSRDQDIEDIRGADGELAKELRFLEDKDAKKYDDIDDPTVAAVLRTLSLAGPISGPASPFVIFLSELSQSEVKKTMQAKQREWDQLWSRVWRREDDLSEQSKAAVRRLFENYMHDSRAWFKILVPDDEDWFTLGQREAVRRDQEADLNKRMMIHDRAGDQPGYERLKAQLEELRAKGPLLRDHREPYRMYGYIRSRRIYQVGTLNESDFAKRQHLIDQEEGARTKRQQADEKYRRHTDEENVRHDKEMGRLIKDDHRVIHDEKLAPANKSEARDSSKWLVAKEKKLHSDNLKAIQDTYQKETQ